MKMKFNKRIIFVAFLFFIFYFLISIVYAVAPFGASVTSGSPETAPADAAGAVPAQAGNITELMINGFSTTQSWQGFYGNVTGTIQLADADYDFLYNFTPPTPPP